MSMRIIVVGCRVLSEDYTFDFTKDAARHRGLDTNVQCPDLRVFDGANECKSASLQQARRTQFD